MNVLTDNEQNSLIKSVQVGIAIHVTVEVKFPLGLTEAEYLERFTNEAWPVFSIEEVARYAAQCVYGHSTPSVKQEIFPGLGKITLSDEPNHFGVAVEEKSFSGQAVILDPPDDKSKGLRSTQFTPGPWFSDTQEGCRIYSPAHTHAIARTYGPDLNAIGTAELTGPKNRADGSLIAASPEMFNLLVEIEALNDLKRIILPRDLTRRLSVVLDKATKECPTNE